jgi:hypothetical protein
MWVLVSTTRHIVADFGNGRGYVCFHFGFGKVRVLCGNTGCQAAEFGRYFVFFECQ